MLIKAHFGYRPIQKCQYFVLLYFLWNCVNDVAAQSRGIPIPGAYVGCYPEKIDLYEAPIIVGTADKCIEFCEKSYFRYAVLSSDKCACSNELEGEEIEKSLCSIRCNRNRSQFCGGIDVQSYYDTGIIASGPPRNLRIVNKTETTITLFWDPPQQANQVTKYVLKADIIKSFATEMYRSQPEWIVQNKAKHFELSPLHPGTRYNISLSAICEDRECGAAYIVEETLIGQPYPSPEEPKTIEYSGSTLTIDINPAINNNGPISYYRLIVMFINDLVVQNFDESLLTDYKQSKENGLSYYITAELEYQNQTRRFIIGDGKKYRGYYNAPLPPNSHVHISLGVVSVWNGLTKVTYAMGTHDQHNLKVFSDYAEDNQSPIMPLVIACVIFGVLLVSSIIAYIYLRFKTGNRRQRLTEHHELTPQGPILEVDNNGLILDDVIMKHDFKAQLNNIVESIDSTQRYSRSALRLSADNVIAQGNFGDVIYGKLYTNFDSHDCQVHVVSDDMESQDQALFLHEFKQLIRIMPHEKFITFFGVSASPDWFYVIFENAETLKKTLIESRVDPSENNRRISKITENYILQWMYDLSIAMEYLETKQVLHKKLCSYSVYITNLNQVKVSIFGPISFDDGGNSIDISRWMAPEVLRFQRHSTKSDVWSFGCVAWECCCLGATLFASSPSQDLLSRIRNGDRPHQPAYVSDDLYQLFINCWQIEPNDRSEFEEISQHLGQMLTSPKHFLSFDRRDGIEVEFYMPLLEAANP